MPTDFNNSLDIEHLDALELADAILGDGVVLQETPQGGFVIHVVTPGHVQRLGSYVDAAAAWRALDDIDRHPGEWQLHPDDPDLIPHEADAGPGLAVSGRR